MSFLSSLVLGLLLISLLFVDGLFVSSLFGSQSFLSLLDFSNGLLSKGLFVLRASVFHFFYIVKSNTLDGSFFSEDFLLLVFSLVGLFKFFVETSPGSGPSESLGF